jgi:hypothetical protein
VDLGGGLPVSAENCRSAIVGTKNPIRLICKFEQASEPALDYSSNQQKNRYELEGCGRRGRNRTCNPQIRNLMLYPFELRAHVIHNTSPAGCTALILYQPLQGFLTSVEDRKVATRELFHLIVELARKAQSSNQS